MCRSRTIVLRPVAPAALVAVVALALTGCASVMQMLEESRPHAEVVGVRLTDVGLEQVALGFDVRVDNPSPIALPLVQLDYRLAHDDTGFLSGEVALDGTVPSQGSRTVTLPLTVGLREVVSLLTGVRPGGVVPYRAELGVAVDGPTGRLRLPLVHDGELPIPALPTVSLQGITWDELSLMHAGGTVRLAVTNTNRFDLDLTRLSVGLSLSGADVARLAATPGSTVPAGATGVVEIPIGLSPLDLGGAILTVIRGHDAAYGLDGVLSVGTRFGDITMPLAATGRVPFR